MEMMRIATRKIFPKYFFLTKKIIDVEQKGVLSHYY